jgi:hypothetical protein
MSGSCPPRRGTSDGIRSNAGQLTAEAAWVARSSYNDNNNNNNNNGNRVPRVQVYKPEPGPAGSDWVPLYLPLMSRVGAPLVRLKRV